MGGIFSKGTLLVWTILGAVVFLAAQLKRCVSQPNIRASVSPRKVFLGDPIAFPDSTLDRDELVGDFGNLIM